MCHFSESFSQNSAEKYAFANRNVKDCKYLHITVKHFATHCSTTFFVRESCLILGSEIHIYMTVLTSAQKKELAKALYLETSLTQQEIADRVGVARRTIARWTKEEWQGLKVNYLQTREVLVRSTLMQLEQLDSTINGRDEGARYPTAKEADIRRKLTADLEALEQDASVREVINVSRGILDYVRQLNLDHAKLLSDYLDAYIKEKIKWAN